MTYIATNTPRSAGQARLDDAHFGDILGAFGTIAVGETQTSSHWRRRLMTLFAILGPGLIVMVGDNDAGAFGTYAQAGQNYGTSLLWTLLLLVPVLFVNQEMVLRLGAVTGVGHARLIFERFGRFWGAFSVIDLFLLNALTIVTEFIGITLGLDYLGLPRLWGVIAAALVVIAAASTGSFRRFERFMMVLVFGSLLLVPIALTMHPPVGQIAHDFFVPGMPKGGKLADVMLLIIAIVGTTVAPWQLFFQQSYIIDKRIGPHFIAYAKVDLWLGILIVVIGGVAMMAFAAAAFHGTAWAGQFTDAGGAFGSSDGRIVRGRADRRLDHRRGGGVAQHRLCDRRRVQHPPFTAPQAQRRDRLLPGLCRADRGGGGAGADPGHAARSADQCGSDPGRGAVAERVGVPAPVVQ